MGSVKYTQLRGRQGIRINKPISDLCYIIAMLAEQPTSVYGMSKRLELSWPYTRDLVQVLIEANAVCIEKRKVHLFPTPIYLSRILEVMGDRPFGILPEQPTIADFILFEVLDRVGEIDLTQFTSVISLRKPHTDSPE